MKVNSAYFFFLLMLVGACAPRFDIVDDSGLPMFQVQRSGLCFIGCNLHLKRADGVICSGYAPGIEAGAGLSALMRCPEDSLPGTRSLVTTPLRTDMAAIGVLAPIKTTDERNREAIEEALAYADQFSKTN